MVVELGAPPKRLDPLVALGDVPGLDEEVPVAAKPGSELTEKCVNTIRMLAADAIQQANSGHPGLPMGCADLAHVLWTRHLRFNPDEPRWIDRDRFILSAGHGSMLLYALLHLAGYGVTLEDLKRFRQLGSKTPGHPEFGRLAGVEVTSGPLGQGFANGVGMALGQAMLSARLGPGNPIENHCVYAIVSDGDLMEGVTAEAASFAGHNRLGRLIYLYDDNQITIDGRTSITFSGEDVTRRFQAYGWHVSSVDGRDGAAISRAIEEAKAELARPSLIRIRTTIGFGAPNKQGKSAVHGAPLGEEELKAAKENLGWPLEPRFLVPEDVRAHWQAVVNAGRTEWRAWQTREAAWRQAHPDQARLLDSHLSRTVPTDIGARLLEGVPGADATRKIFQAVLNQAAPLVPSLLSGSADLFESCLNEVKGGGRFSPESADSRNVAYGIREHAMGAILNGLAYDGQFIPMASTFLIFSDYMRPPIRLAALAGLQVIYVWTHDSIFVGEDGPTHQPVEQLTALRAIPNLHVVRPADGPETAAGLTHALQRHAGPTALVLTRQKLAPVARNGFDPAAFARGGYVVQDAPTAKLTVMACGSELPAAQAALDLLAKKGIAARLVSIPCLACFEAQPQSYQRQVLPDDHRRCAIEAARGIEWWRHVGRDGLVIGIDGFGASGPEKSLAEAYGLSPTRIAERIQRWLAGSLP